MIGKHVVIDTLDNFKAKLNLIPSSAIVLIKDVGQIYAHGTYFGAQKTYSLLTKTADGLAPKGGTSASSLIKDGATEWVLTVTNGENPSWRRLPDNAFNSLLYTLPAATTTELGGIKVGKLYTATFSDLVGKYYKINIDKDGLAYVEVPWTDNDYRVEQVSTSVLDEDFRVVFSGTAVDATKTETLRKSSKLLFNPVSGKLTSTTFEGNLDGKYINKLTDYSIAKQEAAISVNDSLNQALGKLEYKLDSAYNWYKGVIGTDEDEIINKWDEIVDFVKNVSEGTDLVDEFVTRKTDLTITGLKTFESNSDEVGVSLILKNKGWLGNMSTAMDFYNGRNYVVPNARIETKMVGNGRAGGTLIFYTQSKHDSTNPNPNGLTERLRIDDLGTITASTDLLVNKNITGAKLITIGGTSSQFLKGDGTLDSNLYYSVKGLKYNEDQAWDWNDITEVGTYKIQKGNPTANHPKRDDTANSYPFGLALVIQGIKNDAEKRIALVYFPHDWINYNDIPLYLRMRNSETWTSWAKIPSVDFVTKLCAKYLPLTGGTLTNTLQIGSDNNVDYMMLRLVRAGHAVTVNNTDADAFVCFGSYTNSSFTNERALIIGDNGLRYSDNGLKSNYKIWHAGNDGIDSGLDADKLDGFQLVDILNYGAIVNPHSSSTGWYKFLTLTGYTNDGMIDFIVSSAEVSNYGISYYFHFETRPSEKWYTFTYYHLGKNDNTIKNLIYVYSEDNKTYNFYLKYPKAETYSHFIKVKHVCSRGASYVYNTIFQASEPAGTSFLAEFAGAVKYAELLNNSITFSSGAFTGKTYNGSSAVTVNIPTKMSLLENDSNYLTTRGYIGTTSVQNESKAQSLTGINKIVVPNNSSDIYGIGHSWGDAANDDNNLARPWYGLTWSQASVDYNLTMLSSFYGITYRTGGTSHNHVFKGGNVRPYADAAQTLGTSSYRWSNFYSSAGNFSGIVTMGSRLRMVGTSETPAWDNAGAITWAESDLDSQPVSLVYTSYDTYRAPAGLVLLGSQGNEWFEVKGNIYGKGFVKSSSSDSYVLLGGGGHKKISDLLLTSELTTFEKTLNVTSDWMDTGIAYDDLPADGTYIVQVSVKANDSTGNMWSCYWGGVMVWYVSSSNTKTNDNETDEILLHRSGHAYENTIYLRTVMTVGGSSGEGVKLQIAANKNIGKEYKYTFKFKRII